MEGLAVYPFTNIMYSSRFRSLHIDDTDAYIFPSHPRLERTMGGMVERATAFLAHEFRLFLLEMVRLNVATE